MEMVRGRGAASWPIVEDRPAVAKITHEVKKNIDMFSDGLRLMDKMGNSEMTGKNRHGVAENKEFLLVEDPFLLFRQILEAEKTWPFVDAFFSNICQGTPDSSGVMLDSDGKPAAGDLPCLCIFQGFVALLQITPRLFLFRQEIHTNLGERFHTLSPFKNSEHFRIEKCGVINDISPRTSSR